MSFRPEHSPVSDPCERCSLPAHRHRVRKRERAIYQRNYTRERRAKDGYEPRPNNSFRIIGIDGEGQGRDRHVYNFLAAADENGKTWQLGDDRHRQISTVDFLEFVLDLPSRALVFFFAGLYDLTKALEDLPDQELGDLFHESRRLFFKDGKPRYRSVRWKGYRLNFINRRLTVSDGVRRTTLWDVFAFFQSRFTKALLDWKVGDADEIRAMERMKEQRERLDQLPFDEVKSYCLSECKNLAQLGRALLDAHERADLKLRSYFGCGSTATALMNRHDVRKFKAEPPAKMRHAIACSFFGGRFENSVLGAVTEPVDLWDINAAYPYAFTFMPCLVHGKWEWTTRNLDRIGDARLALILWRNPGGSGPSSWGPLPVRMADGTIRFPLAAVEGWTWRDEYLAARKLCPNVEAVGAWVYETDCACKPFGFLPDIYLQRLALGSDTAGLPLKNGGNSVYGKTVQTLGHEPPFQSFVWGANCTSSCRAQILDLAASADRPDDVLMVATDGVGAKKTAGLKVPAPRDTGTADAVKLGDGKKGPLGAWSLKTYQQGMFFARPGIYFPLNPQAEDLEKVRARGLGRKVLYENTDRVVEAWANGEEIDVGGGRKVPGVQLPPVSRFVGAKTGLHLQSETWVRSENYGKWIPHPTRVSFDPNPKRRSVGMNGRLECWPRATRPSLPYDKAIIPEEVLALRAAATIAEEQPTGDYTEVD